MAKRGKKRPEALYRPLPPGSHGIDRSDVERHQRARIQGATIQAVVRNGYPATTLAAIVDLASVSRSTFYQHFSGKEDCVVQTCDLLVTLGMEQISEARDSASGTDTRQRLRTVLAAFMRLVAAEPAAAQLVLVETVSATSAVVAHRNRVTMAFEELFRQGFDETSADGRVSDLTVEAIVGGILHVVGLHLRNGTADTLPGMTDDLLRWALNYQVPDVDPPQRPLVPAATPTAADPTAGKATKTADTAATNGHGNAPGSGGRPRRDGAQAGNLLDHRQRIVLAVSSVVEQKGYKGLTIPDISATAGISNQTFYAVFEGKEEAFLATYDENAERALRTTRAAFEAIPTWPDAMYAGLAALLDFIATHPSFARLALVELPIAGDAAQQRWARTLKAFSMLLQPGRIRAPEVPPIVAQAVTGGIWNVVYDEYARGRLPQLPTLTPALAYFSLAPYIGAGAAASTSDRAPDAVDRS